MDEPCFVQQSQAIKQLLSKYTNQGSAETSELVLLYQLVQIDAEKLENEAQMLSMNKCIFKSKKMVIIVFVEFSVKLNEKKQVRA